MSHSIFLPVGNLELLVDLASPFNGCFRLFEFKETPLFSLICSDASVITLFFFVG